ncbi:unnamed protein product [Schistosoma mattheei]|uniref:DUF4590 domain-containing protein n=1 Tax=Schistosoma mattheei TaxID=31246 RepID=A0A3P8ICJ7_9TREM|nr:unnamed protein product [Schistosoma mattheei]
MFSHFGFSTINPDTFQIISKRVYGFPFSLTIYVDGTQDTRISACCEYRHRQGARIGGKHGHFIYLSVEGSFPCFRCRALKKLRQQQQQQEKMKRKEKFTTEENDNKIQHEEANEYDNSDELKGNSVKFHVTFSKDLNYILIH